MKPKTTTGSNNKADKCRVDELETIVLQSPIRARSEKRRVGKATPAL